MKRHSASLCIISLLILCLTGINSIYAQKQAIDTITIYHKYYTSTFSKSKRFPVVVKYWLTRSMLDCERRYKRFSRFKPDPSIPEFTSLDKDYKNSGYDRGHHMDAFDCDCDSIAMAESFYYSNVAPQLPSLNRGIWKKLEEYTRKLAKKYDSILVWCGSVTFEDRYIGRIAVPDYCWKIIYVKRFGIVKAYSFRNNMTFKRELPSFEVSVDSVCNLSSFGLIQKPLKTRRWVCSMSLNNAQMWYVHHREPSYRLRYMNIPFTLNVLVLSATKGDTVCCSTFRAIEG